MAQTDVLRYPPPFVPPQVTLDGYTSALTTSGEFIRTSLIYGLGTILVTMIIATPAAYALARIRSRIGLFLLIALILAQMAPGFVVANSLYAMFSRLKLINSYIAVILADSTGAVPFAIIIMRAFMLSIPSELSEAALVDGAGHWTIFWSICRPDQPDGDYHGGAVLIPGWLGGLSLCAHAHQQRRTDADHRRYLPLHWDVTQRIGPRLWLRR